MFHEAIDIFALVVAFVTLIPLWREQKKVFIYGALVALLLVSAAYLIWEKIDHRVQLAHAEQAIMAAVCKHPDGMGFDEIYAHNIDYGSQAWELTDEAFGDLTDRERLVIETKLIPSWDNHRTVPLRIWHVKYKDHCKEPVDY